MQENSPVYVSNLTARYEERNVLQNIHLHVDPAEIRVILGGSGCGKSTLLRHIIGLKTPVEGEVKILGIDVYKSDENDRNTLFKRIGVMFQNNALLNSLTLHENVALPIQENTKLPNHLINEIVRIKLALVGLEKDADKTPRELSGGMKKRAAMARAIALDPEVLFCDEPSAGLDPITAAGIDQLILDLRNRFGMAIVVVTHDLDSIKTIADKVTMLGSHGTVIADGTIDAIIESSYHPQHSEIRAFFERDKDHKASQRFSVWRALQLEGTA